MKKRLKIILIVLAVIALLVVLLLAGLKKVFINMLTSPMAPDDYTSGVKTGGTIEAKYLAHGNADVKLLEVSYPDNEDTSQSLIKGVSVGHVFQQFQLRKAYASAGNKEADLLIFPDRI